MTVAIDLGTGPDKGPATLDLEELLATRLLVQGNSGSGKSHLLRRLLEQSAPWVQQAVIDPEGDFVSLADDFGHIVIDAAQHDEMALQAIADRVRQHRISVVLDLEGLDAERQMRHAAAFLGGLFDAERDFWYPMLVVIDEAQLFAPSAAGDIGEDARKLSLGAMTNLMCRGRKRGLAGVIATQRLAKLAKNVAAEASNFLMGRTFLDIDMARAADLLGMERRQAEMFRDLQRGHFVALGPALSRRPLPIRIGEALTPGRNGSPKLVPLPDRPPTDAKELILAPDESGLPRPILRRPAPPPPPPAMDLLTQLARAKPQPLHPLPLSPGKGNSVTKLGGPVLDEILRQVLGDPDAAFRSVAVLYQDFLVRCRAQAIRGDALDLAAFRRKLPALRASLGNVMPDHPDWPSAVSEAAGLPEDIQGVYLLLARAALLGQPCPSDAMIARVYGSRSAGRARRLLAYLEQHNIVHCRHDLDGNRVAILPALGWETAPGAADRESQDSAEEP